MLFDRDKRLEIKKREREQESVYVFTQIRVYTNVRAEFK